MNDIQGSVERAQVWLEQGRPDRAEKELREALAADPQHTFAHLLLSLCLSNLDRGEEALREAEATIGLAPDLPAAHYAHACALQGVGRRANAHEAIARAIELNPEDEDFWSLSAALHFEDRRWTETVRAADTALAIDPEHLSALNLRARALDQMGRSAEADATLEGALERDPENPWTHSNVGWSLLNRGKARDATPHFREALRLDPSLEPARVGLLESIKAVNPFYRAMFAYFSFMSRLSKRGVWLVIALIFLGPALLRRLESFFPILEPAIGPLIGLIYAFALLTWIVQPLADAALFLHPVGKHALSDPEKKRALAVTICLVLAVVLIAGGLAISSAPVGFIGIGLFAYVLPLSAGLGVERKPQRNYALAILGVITLFALLALIGGVGFAATNADPWLGLVLPSLVICGLGTLGLSLAANRWSM